VLAKWKRRLAACLAREAAELRQKAHRDLFEAQREQSLLPIRSFQSFTEGNEDQFSSHITRFVLLVTSVQYSESDRRLAAEFISPLPLQPPVKPDSRVGLGSPSAFIALARRSLGVGW